MRFLIISADRLMIVVIIVTTGTAAQDVRIVFVPDDRLEFGVRRACSRRVRTHDRRRRDPFQRGEWQMARRREDACFHRSLVGSQDEVVLVGNQLIQFDILMRKLR